MITARTHDFEDSAQFHQLDTIFDELYILRPWSVEVEFRDYLARLSRAKLIKAPSLYADVIRSEELSTLVSRPLHARMLTFIGEESTEAFENRSALYSEYIAKLSRVADASLERRRCQFSGGTISVWKSLAWASHISGAHGRDALPLRVLEAEVQPEASRDCVRAAIDQIVDRREILGNEIGYFVHYSFYEYLVAKKLLDDLDGATDINVIADQLRHDLPREIRHFAVGQLQAAGPSDLTNKLEKAYRAISRDRSLEVRDRLSAGNMIVYLISRAPGSARTALERLLSNEEEIFLRNALLWSLCHLGSRQAAKEFFVNLGRDETWRSQSRGYVLYYYGDLRRDEGPPYMDDPPYGPATRTYQQVMGMFGGSEFAKVAAPRRCIDVYTFLDILAVRGTPLAQGDRDRLRRIAADLLHEEIDADISIATESMLQSVLSDVEQNR
jgi:hypothetical protein